MAGGLSSSRNHFPTLMTRTITGTFFTDRFGSNVVTMRGGGTNMIRFHSFVHPRIIIITPIAKDSNTSFMHINGRTLMYAHVFLVGPNDTRRGALTCLILLQRLISITMLCIVPILHLHFHAPICGLCSCFLCFSLLQNIFHEFCVHILESLYGLSDAQEDFLGAGVQAEAQAQAEAGAG